MDTPKGFRYAKTSRSRGGRVHSVGPNTIDVVQSATLFARESGSGGGTLGFNLRIEKNGTDNINVQPSISLEDAEARAIPGEHFLFPQGAMIEPGSTVYIEDIDTISDAGILVKFRFSFARYRAPNF